MVLLVNTWNFQYDVVTWCEPKYFNGIFIWKSKFIHVIHIYNLHVHTQSQNIFCKQTKRELPIPFLECCQQIATPHEESPEHEVITRSREIKYVSVIQILKIIISNTTEIFMCKTDFHTRETFLYNNNNNNKIVFLMKEAIWEEK